MRSRPDRPRFRPACLPLDPRRLLSGASHPAAIVHARGLLRPHPPFPAISAPSFNSLLGARLATSANSTQRVDAAFQAFLQNYLGVPVAQQGKPQGPSSAAEPEPAVGTLPADRSLEGFLAQLTSQVDLALATYKPTTTRILPSLRAAPKVTPDASRALIPFADARIARLGDVLRVQAPTPRTASQPADRAALDAVDEAFNAILNAEAENSIHPSLFRRPEDFYINPAVRFRIPFTGAPAQAGPGFLTRGPGGAPLVAAGGHAG